MQIDLSFFIEPPKLEQDAKLEILALAPLSMVSSQPGTYFRTEINPNINMLYGLLENALGWHLEDKLRRKIFKALKKIIQKNHRKNEALKNSDWLNGKPNESGSSYFSFLSYHLALEELTIDKKPLSYDDLWSMHLRTKGDSFIGGSRSYDLSLENLITISRQKRRDKDGNSLPPDITFSDKKDFITFSIEELKDLVEGKVKTNSLKPYFPHYYVSPKKRGYVIPRYSYRFKAICCKKLSALISQALENPNAPLYLGSNDGWVDVKWTPNE